MGSQERRRRRSPRGSLSSSPASSLLDEPEDEGDLRWPFGRLVTLGPHELRETAYELFYVCCRPHQGGTIGRSANPRLASDCGDAATRAFPHSAPALSRVKSTLGRKAGLAAAAAMRRMPNYVSPAVTSTLPSPSASVPKSRQRLTTTVELMRMQMGLTEQTDARLRKSFTRFLSGQLNKPAETIMLPLELLRHLRPSEFEDYHEYHRWQRRQLKVLEAGLLLHPSSPADRVHSTGLRFREIVAASELKPIDTSKHSEAMRILCNCVMTLAWRYQSFGPADVCHWADGFPLNVHLYLALLRAVFDRSDETVVIDEVDQLLELMKKTWPTLGINKMIHNVLFAWVLFEQFVTTGQSEPELMRATLEMLDEVANDAERPDREKGYMMVLIPTMNSMKMWAEKKLLDYHQQFDEGEPATMESVLCLAIATEKIISEETSKHGSARTIAKHRSGNTKGLLPHNRVEHYIRTSVKSAFTKVYENGNGKVDSMVVEVDEDPNDTLTDLAKETENLALLEKQRYSPLLKKWHPCPTAVAAATLHGCFGRVLKEYVCRVTDLTNELVRLLETAGNLEKVLIQMAEADSSETREGEKQIKDEIVSYEVDSIAINFMQCWLDDRMRMGRECLSRAKETESWNPMSKEEPYAESAVDLLKLSKLTVDEFFEIRLAGKDKLVQELGKGLDALFKDYSTFTSSCGSKESYVPPLPPLTRCNQDSKFAQLWKRASTPCSVGGDANLVPICQRCYSLDRHSTSRGTQRLIVRLNTLHHILGLLNSMEKSFAAHDTSCHHFDGARSSIQAAIFHVAEVAAYRLIFLDSSPFFYDSLYSGSGAGARIHQTLRVLTLNLAHLSSALVERAKRQVLQEVTKVSFEAFLMVVLAGGCDRAFTRQDHDMVAEDFACLKRLFTVCWEGLLKEEVVEQEAEAAKGVVRLMALPTEKLVATFSFAASEASGLGREPLAPTTGRWHCSDPNTMLRVLCHRNDDVANRFLRRTLELPRRR